MVRRALNTGVVRRISADFNGFGRAAASAPEHAIATPNQTRARKQARRRIGTEAARAAATSGVAYR
jgi:hypothetical protein